MATFKSKSMSGKEAYDANDRKIDARLERIALRQKELEEGDAAYAAWPAERLRIQRELGDNQEKFERYMARRAELGKAMNHELDVNTLHRMEEQIARLKRKIEHGDKVTKATKHEPPVIDFFGS